MKKIHHLIAITFLVLLCCTTLFSCAEREEDGSGISYFSFTDSSNYTVTLRNKPQRVAVLFSSLADLWQIAGGNVAITVGESVERKICGADVLLVDAGAGKTIDTERLISYQPDFVIGSLDIVAHQRVAQVLRDADICVALFRVEQFSDYLKTLDIMTDITGQKARYEQYGVQIQQKIDALLHNTPDDSKTKILFVRAGTSARATKAKTAKEHFACQMLNELGAYNIAENAPILLDGLSIEEILRENPTHIFITTMGNAADATAYMMELLQSDVWQGLDAVKSENVHFLSKELFQFKPNARWYEAYLTLAEILYETE